MTNTAAGHYHLRWSQLVEQEGRSLFLNRILKSSRLRATEKKLLKFSLCLRRGQIELARDLMESCLDEGDRFLRAETFFLKAQLSFSCGEIEQSLYISTAKPWSSTMAF